MSDLLTVIKTYPNYVDRNTPTDEAVYMWLNEDVIVVGAIPSRKLIAWGAAGSRLKKIADAAESLSDSALASVARAAQLTIEREDTELDMGDAAHVALVDVLISGGVLSASDKIELEALASSTKKRHQVEDVQATMAAIRLARKGT